MGGLNYPPQPQIWVGPNCAGTVGTDCRVVSQVGIAGLDSMDSRTLAMVFMAGAFLPTARGVRPDGDTPLTCGVAQFVQHLASHKAASHSADGPYRNVGLYQDLKELAASRHPMRVV